jgi:GTP cyclohydrolase I
VGEDASAPLAHTISVSSGPAPDTVPSGAVMLRDIRFRSMCEHHLLPFTGHAHIAYLPGEQVVGLGALPKVVSILASRPQVQERLGEQIADTIMASLDCRGVLVVLDATHQCVTTRGEQQADASTVTIAARGELAEPVARAELIALIGAGSGR